MTVNEIIVKIDFINRTINELETRADDGETIVGTANVMRDAAELLEGYRSELRAKKVV